jgi:tetratricopeptide (TPR) repeat protein
LFYRDASPLWQEKAFVGAEKALALDPGLAEAFLARADLAWTRVNRFPHEPAMADIRRALALNPNLVAARWAAARIYNHVGLFDKGLAELDAARRVDPRDLAILVRRGQLLAGQRDFGAALEAFEAAGSRHVPRVAALWGVGREAEAERMLAEFLLRHPREAEGAAYHALILARRGEESRAREEIARAVTLDRGHSHMHHAMHNIGAAYSVLGEADEALEWLQRSAAEGFPCYPVFASDPDLAPLANDPRFQGFLARLKARWERYRRTL